MKSAGEFIAICAFHALSENEIHELPAIVNVAPVRLKIVANACVVQSCEDRDLSVYIHQKA
jgi:hypothetical protein